MTTGYRKTGNPIYDLNERYAPEDLNDPTVRARIRREAKGQIEIKLVDGVWQLLPHDASEKN
jgi:hypothetical protein